MDVLTLLIYFPYQPIIARLRQIEGPVWYTSSHLPARLLNGGEMLY